MRPFAVAFLLCLAAAPAALAQDLVIPPVRIPTLATAAATAEGFVPRGWGIEARATGDLDGDGDADLAMVLRSADPALVIDNDGLGEPSFDTNPRILAVAFAAPGGGYRLGVQNATYIARRTNPVQSDSFSVDGDGFTILRGTLRVRQELFMSAGGWGKFNVTHTFRWQHGRLELIGLDRVYTQRNTGEMELVSINYSTGKVKLTTTRIDSDEETVRWKTLPDRRRISIDEMGDGLEFQSGFDG